MFDDKEYSLHEVRYGIEHIFFRELFFEKGVELINPLLEKGPEFVYGFCQNIYADAGIETLYTQEDYTVDSYKIPELNAALIEIGMPQPETTPLCHRIYFVFNRDLSRRSMFTIEKAADNSDVSAYLCGWGNERQHLNYGEAPEDEDSQMTAILNIFGNS